MFRDLADEAPDDLTDEWQTFVNALEGLQDAQYLFAIASDWGRTPFWRSFLVNSGVISVILGLTCII